MALVTLRIGGYNHTVGCEDGQERHLQMMAAEVERRVERVRPAAGGGSEGRLFALAALMLADELHDLRAEITAGGYREVIKEVIREVPVIKEVIREVPVEVPVEILVEVPVADSVFAGKLEAIARRAEEIAAGLEQA